MDYERLPVDYYSNQVTRVEDLRAKIVDRGNTIASGTVFPEDSELAIGTGRRLDTAIMFLDLYSYSWRTAETENEQDMLLRMMNLFFTEMIRIGEAYGGAVEKNTGDGLMIHFEDGGGKPPERGCKRAVACALTMMFTAKTLINPIITTSRLEELRFRVGIDYGPITIARVGAAK